MQTPLSVILLCAGSVFALFLSPGKHDCLRLWRRMKFSYEKAGREGGRPNANATWAVFSRFSQAAE
jgi:hypothetical protein